MLVSHGGTWFTSIWERLSGFVVLAREATAHAANRRPRLRDVCGAHHPRLARGKGSVCAESPMSWGSEESSLRKAGLAGGLLQ